MARSIDIWVTNNVEQISRLVETGPRIAQKYIDRPITYENGSPKLITPNDARLKNLTYETHIYADILVRIKDDSENITNKTFSLTKSTKGMVLMTRDGRIVPAFYHAKCGGRTLTPKEVWGNYIKGYKGKK